MIYIIHDYYRAVPCRLSVARCPGARHSVPVDLLCHNGRARVHGTAVESEAEQQQITVAVRALGRLGEYKTPLGRLGGYKTPLEQLRQARCQANSSGDSG